MHVPIIFSHTGYFVPTIFRNEHNCKWNMGEEHEQKVDWDLRKLHNCKFNAIYTQLEMEECYAECRMLKNLFCDKIFIQFNHDEVHNILRTAVSNVHLKRGPPKTKSMTSNENKNTIRIKTETINEMAVQVRMVHSRMTKNTCHLCPKTIPTPFGKGIWCNGGYFGLPTCEACHFHRSWGSGATTPLPKKCAVTRLGVHGLADEPPAFVTNVDRFVGEEESMQLCREFGTQSILNMFHDVSATATSKDDADFKRWLTILRVFDSKSCYYLHLASTHFNL